MKVRELLTELRYGRGSPAKSFRIKPDSQVQKPDGTFTKPEFEVVATGAFTFNKPHFRPLTKADSENLSRGGAAGLGAVLGTVGEWLKLMGAERSDLPKAIEQVRASPEYRELLRLGFEDISNPAELKNGTLHFEAHPGELIGDPSGERPPELRRRVLANGSIRGFNESNRFHGWRQNVPRPWTIETHPDNSPVERIAGSMRQSIKQLAKSIEPKIKKIERKAMFKASS